MEKTMEIELEEGEEIKASIRKAMHENKVKKCGIKKMDGIIRKGAVREEGSGEEKEFNEAEAISATGILSLTEGGLIGEIRVGAKKGFSFYSGTLTKGIAAQGFKVEAAFSA